MRPMTASFLSECVSLVIRVIHHSVSQFVPIQDNHSNTRICTLGSIAQKKRRNEKWKTERGGKPSQSLQDLAVIASAHITMRY
ncbi:hypothetical protein HDV62DRAFT_20566 [Trichoderma sp. SZMC 28011]